MVEKFLAFGRKNDILPEANTKGQAMKKIHSVHIPVMGIGFSIDTPIKVAQYGISSVISLVDDVLIEAMRKYYCGLLGEDYKEIAKSEEDFRAKRITSYLNWVDKIVKHKFEEVKNSPFEPGSEMTKYFEMLPEKSPLRALYKQMLTTENQEAKCVLQNRLRDEMGPGEIDVNIMTKLDKTNYSRKKEELPQEYSDALSALRGYANSTLESAIVFSAGFNRRLYSYVEKFEDFHANDSGTIKKRIILKVSDYRSAIIQGRFFAKKGLWVSEYRIESGLNCGGHAFPSDGFLMGPILEEFKQKKRELIDTLHAIYNSALEAKNRPSFTKPHPVEITAQGGIGTHEEYRFLLDYYQIDGTGWATPFLLVPEATSVDQDTLQKLTRATEDDLYSSDVSPLGVPFNNLRGNNSDLEKEARIQKKRPGSACPNGYLASNTEFTKIPICTASRQYQKLKIEELERMNVPEAEYRERYNKIVVKSCICNDLAASPLIEHNLSKKGKRFTAVCPGPNLAYFSKVSSLSDMIGHIYGRLNLLNDSYRPHMFIQELKMYIDYFKKEIDKCKQEATSKQKEALETFRNNLRDGINYYKTLFPKIFNHSKSLCDKALSELSELETNLDSYVNESRLFLNDPQPSTISI